MTTCRGTEALYDTIRCCWHDDAHSPRCRALSAGGRARRRSCRGLPEQEAYHQVHQEAYCQVHQVAHQGAHVSSSRKLHQSRVRFFARAASPPELTQAGAARLAIAVRSRRRTPPRFGLELYADAFTRDTEKVRGQKRQVLQQVQCCHDVLHRAVQCFKAVYGLPVHRALRPCVLGQLSTKRWH